MLKYLYKCRHWNSVFDTEISAAHTGKSDKKVVQREIYFFCFISLATRNETFYIAQEENYEKTLKHMT